VINGSVDLVQGAVASPWFYPALFGFAAVDGFFPAVPSESLVITAGVFAAAGEPNLVLLIAVSALGAFVGDHVSYLIGRTAGRALLRRRRPGARRRAAFDRAAGVLVERGASIVILARYVPGGRTAATMAAGAVRYPIRSFSLFDAVAAVTWGTQAALLGYLGGVAFRDDPVKGLVLSGGTAVAAMAVVEVVRRRRRRR
jgi:membrane protein DedA with SNARE-associated domain